MLAFKSILLITATYVVQEYIIPRGIDYLHTKFGKNPDECPLCGAEKADNNIQTELVPRSTSLSATEVPVFH